MPNEPIKPSKPSSPGTATNVVNEVENTAGQSVAVQTLENRRPNSERPIDTGTQNPSDQEEDPNEPAARAAPIECTVKKRFYDENMRIVREGATYVYVPKVNQPFPYEILEPTDSKVAKRVKREFEDFKSDKRAAIARRTDRDRLIDALSSR